MYVLKTYFYQITIQVQIIYMHTFSSNEIAVSVDVFVLPKCSTYNLGVILEDSTFSILIKNTLLFLLIISQFLATEMAV